MSRPSPVRLLYDVIVPDVLAAIYSMDEPIPVARLAESVWETVRAHFVVDSLSPLGQMGLRGRVDNDVEHIFDAFEALGAVTSTHGVAGACSLKTWTRRPTCGWTVQRRAGRRAA